MDSNLKTQSGRFFQVFALVSQIKSIKTDFGKLFSFKIHLILFPLSLVVLRQFIHEQGPSI